MKVSVKEKCTRGGRFRRWSIKGELFATTSPICSRGNFALRESDHRGIRGFGRDRGEKATGRLRIVKQRAKFLGNGISKLDAAFQKLAIVGQSAGKKPIARRFDRAGKIRNARVIDVQRNVAADSHLARVTQKRKSRDVRDGMNRAAARCSRIDFMQSVSSFAIQARHRICGCANPRGIGLALLERSGNHARADRLRENQNVARARTDISPDAVRDGSSP